MGLFDFFKKNRTELVHLNGNGTMEIPKDVFIEEAEPESSESLEKRLETKIQGIEDIYSFLQSDYESRGYSDAMVNPDASYREDNVQLIKLDLAILIQKVTTYYEDILRELDFHIESRGRAGLIDLVEEMKARKEMVLEHMKKVQDMKTEMTEGRGTPERLVFSYQRGFMRGLSALTYSKVMNKSL